MNVDRRQFIKSAGAVIGAGLALPALEGLPLWPSSIAGAKASGKWGKIVEEAQREGTVVLYTSHFQSQQDGLVIAFRSRYPDIKIQMTRIVTGLAAKLEAERTSGAAGADVAITNDPTVPAQLLSSGYLPKLSVPNVKNYADSEYLYNSRYFLTNVGVLGVGWNTDQVKKPITRFEDFLRPELRGRFAVLDATFSPTYADFYAFVEDQTGPKFLSELAAQQPKFFQSSVPIHNALVSGEIAASIFAAPVLQDEIAKGAPVAFRLPKPKSWAAPFLGFGLEWAKHPNAAMVLMDFLMTKDGQKPISTTGAAALAGVPGLTSIANSSLLQPERSTPQFAATYNDKWRRIFGR